MDKAQILQIILSSSLLIAVVTAIFNRRKTSAEAHKTESDVDERLFDRLERRMDRLEDQQSFYEERDMIHTSAINCAHKCHIPDAECPVLQYLDTHPAPHKYNHNR